MPVPQPTFTATGFQPPAESDIWDAVFADINAAFGGGLNPADETPQGQLVTSMTAAIGNVNNIFAFMTNMFNPVFSLGRWQDGLAYIYFIERNPATPTVVQATCSGATGTTIPLGALAQAEDGSLYACTQAGTIGAGGSVVVQFSCNVPGATPCPAGSLSQIYGAIPGWDSITNVEDGTLGQNEESRSAFEARRFQAVAGNSLGALPSVLGTLLKVSGVLDVYVTENTSSSPVTVGGVTLAAHSIYAAVLGGTDTDVAQALWTKKSPGCDYNGNTTVVVTDTNYPVPQPTYSVKFQRPTALPTLFAVNLVNSPGVPATAAADIQAAVISAFNGEDGGPRARIGSTIYASRYYAGIAALGSWAQIISVQLGNKHDAAAQITGTIDDGAGHAGNTLTVSAVASGTVAVGQTVVDDAGNVAPGTVITGGSGTSWTVGGAAQLVTSRTLYGVVPNQNDVTVQIDETPTLSADDVVVTLT